VVRSQLCRIVEEQLAGTSVLPYLRQLMLGNGVQVAHVIHCRRRTSTPAPLARGNTMAPCVVIGERAADILRAKHGHQ
jgi:hypothetical protein